MSGNVQLLIDPAFALLPTAKDGTRARALGIASKARSQLAPDLPTFAEQGLQGFEFDSSVLPIQACNAARLTAAGQLPERLTAVRVFSAGSQADE